MRKLLLAVLFILALCVNAYATVGVCTQSIVENSLTNKVLRFTCVGGTGGDAGSVANVVLSGISKGMYLYYVEAYPTSGGTAPDAADVLITDVSGLDLMGGYGANLIHATLTKASEPYNTTSSNYWNPYIYDEPTLSVANHTTSGGMFTIDIYLAK